MAGMVTVGIMAPGLAGPTAGCAETAADDGAGSGTMGSSGENPEQSKGYFTGNTEAGP